jgi:hypothetical protein
VSREDPLPRPKAEREDAHPGLVATLAGLLAFIVALGLVGGGLAVARGRPRAEALSRGPDALFEHGVQARTDLDRAWEAIERAPAPGPGGYAWVDRRAGIVQVPIERAIDLVCAEQRSADTVGERRQSPP